MVDFEEIRHKPNFKRKRKRNANIRPSLRANYQKGESTSCLNH